MTKTRRATLLASLSLLFGGLLAPGALAFDEVRIGGRYLMQVGVFDFDNISGETDSNTRAIRNDVELWFDVEGRAGRALTYGASAEIQFDEDDGGDNLDFDEAYVFLQGPWGRFEGGNQDGPVDKMALFAPFVGQALDLEGDWYEFLDDQVEPFAQVLESLDATKLYYVTPRIGGFQIGVSWAPEGDTEGTQTIVDERDLIALPGVSDVAPQGLEPDENVDSLVGREDLRNWVEVGVRYDVRMGALMIKTFGAYSRADSTLIGTEDLEAFMGGAHLEFGTFTLGGAYMDHDNSMLRQGSEFEQKEWNIGVTWAQGPLGLGVNYAQTDRVFQNGPTDQDTVLGMINYKLARGLDVGASLAYFDQEFLDDDIVTGLGTDNNDGYIVMLQTKVQF